MRLIELTFALFVLAAFTGVTASAVRPATHLVKESQELSQALSQDRLIVKGFRRLCAGAVSRSQLDDWCCLCNGLYPEAKVSVLQAGFTRDSRPVFSCTWKSRQKKRQVFAAGGEGIKKSGGVI